MSSSIGALRVNGDRLWSRLMAMGGIGATPSGGCNRQALTDLDIEGRRLLCTWAEAAGCTARVDSIGNLFLRRPGNDNALPLVLLGSHLDTQPTGGRFDGVFGVLAGLEVIETLNDHGITTRHPVELAVWCNEEGCRFPVPLLGSGVWAGQMSLASAYAVTDRDGRSVREELVRANIQIGESVTRQPVRAAFEVHIEQGPVLEQSAKTIGVVTGVQHMCRYEMIVRGQEAHAGPTPMNLRRDPVRVLANVLPRLYETTAKHGNDARLTIGIIETQPKSSNTVPGTLRCTVDLRHPEAVPYRSLRDHAEQIVEAALAGSGLEGEFRCAWESPGVAFDLNCIDAVRTACAALGYSSLEMFSGAGHDSCHIAKVVPASMIFVPCAGGLSHNEAESAKPSDLAAGANVLLHAMLSLT